MSKMESTWKQMSTRVSAIAAALVASVLSFALAGLCLAACPGVAHADDEEATLTLVVQHRENGVTRNISGAQFAIYQVASLDYGNAYELLDPFTGADVDFNGALTARQATAAAQSIARTARTQDAASIEATSGNDGLAEFDALSYGVYLVVQIDASGVAEKYETMPPFLINVPQFTDDGVVYDVVATPKPELKPTTPSKPNPPKRNPQTGDSLDWNMVGACAAIGLLAMVVALYAARKRRERRE